MTHLVTLETFTCQPYCKKVKNLYKCKEIPKARWGKGGGAVRGTEVNSPSCSLSCGLWTPLLPWPGASTEIKPCAHPCSPLAARVWQTPPATATRASYHSLFEIKQQSQGRVGIAWNASLAAWPCCGISLSSRVQSHDRKTLSTFSSHSPWEPRSNLRVTANWIPETERAISCVRKRLWFKTKSLSPPPLCSGDCQQFWLSS